MDGLTPSARDELAARFDEARPRLRAVAYRMLGSASEADDAVQDAWLRLRRADQGTVANPAGWLTTVVARICLDMLRSREARREEPLELRGATAAAHVDPASNPEQELVLADSVGAAFLVVLERLTPAERLAFVLHDLFAVSFEEIARIVDRTPAAARQLASRARRRVQGRGVSSAAADRNQQREVVDAFLAASRGGDFAALLRVLDPEVVLRADDAAVRIGAAKELRGAQAVAANFAGRARTARPALLDGVAGVAVVEDGHARLALMMTMRDDRIAEISLIADPEHLARVAIVPLDD